MDPAGRPPRIDTQAFAQQGGHGSGSSLLSNHERLIQETRGLGADRRLDWSASGETRPGSDGQACCWLHLQAQVQLPLCCQRCLEPVDVALSVDRWFRFVADEATAEAEDEDCEEDLLVADARFDLATLIEDEILMDLPLIPRHDRCPTAPPLSVADADFDAGTRQQPHPFAGLSRLKNGLVP
ncbi:MAG: DUF177 domain-containing protein [Rhodoferax sp.]|nr:DUF177 domain-containing protein [Rhodoferax sp.]